MKQISYPTYVQMGGASFATTREAVEGMTIVRTDAEKLDYAGTVLTQDDINEKTVATVGREFHTFVIGETGCGKTRRVILPTIRIAAKTGRSMVITDPKGEIYKKTGEAVKRKGYDVLVLNFRDPGRSVRWNPLEMIERLYHSDSRIDRDQAMLMLQDLANTLKGPVHSDKDAFWEVAGAKMFTGVALSIMESCPHGSLTFENIVIVSRKLFLGAINKMSFSRENGYDPVQIVKDIPANHPIASAFTGFLSAAGETARSMLAVFEEMIGLYVTQYSLLDLFSRSEFDIEDLGRKPTALYLIVPDDSSVLYPIATVFVKQVYSALIRMADRNPDDKLENGVSFILDEFANFAPFQDVDSMLTASRSRGITFTLVCQSMEQLSNKDKYPDGVSEVLMSNCRVWIYMSSRNYQFLERLRNLLGNRKDPVSGSVSPLIEIHELQRLRMGQVLLLYDRNKPAYGFLPDYSEYDFGETAPETDLPPKHEDAERTVLDPKDVFEALQRKLTAPKPEEETSGISGVIPGPFSALFRPQQPSPAERIAEEQKIRRLESELREAMHRLEEREQAIRDVMIRLDGREEMIRDLRGEMDKSRLSERKLQERVERMKRLMRAAGMRVPDEDDD